MTKEIIFGLGPLVLLLLVAGVVVFRGLGKESHEKGNISAGGPGEGSPD